MENNWYISVTLLVLKWLTSKLVRELQEMNMLFMLVTLLVLNPLKSKALRE